MSWEHVPSSRNVRTWLWPGLALTSLITVVAFTALTRQDTGTGTLTIGPTAQPAHDASAAPSTNPSDFLPVPLEPPEDSTEIAGVGPLLPDGPDVTVVITDNDQLRSINIATGDIRRSRGGTQIDPWTLFAVGESLITNASTSVVRITGADHQRVRLARNYAALPTLDDTSVWVFQRPPGISATTVVRVGLDGAASERITLPAIAQPQAGVGGSVFVWTPSGIHAVSRDGVRRITSSGLLLAVNVDRLAWFDCSADLTCQIVIGTHDEPDQVRSPVAASELPAGMFGITLGEFSPDGRRLALPLFGLGAERGVERSTVAIIDTATGAELTRLAEREGSFEGAPLAWSPDGQWLFVAAGDRLIAWNAGNGELTDLDTARAGMIHGLAVIENR